MTIWRTALGLGVVDNPIVDSLYTLENSLGAGSLPAVDGLLTEGGVFILTEGGDNLTTE